ncbi:MAG TPA: hypothetical protein VF463_00560 [Sphingobium sp.]
MERIDAVEIVAIDFEASCLPRDGRSYPIEVGISDGHESWSWLIRPHPCWSGWDWTAEAQAVHGISLDTLWGMGQPADVVMRELIARIDGRRLVADSGLDQYWLDALAMAADESAVPRIGHVMMLLDEWAVSGDQVKLARAHADREQTSLHRAADDARWLALVLGHLAIATGRDAPLAPRFAGDGYAHAA